MDSGHLDQHSCAGSVSYGHGVQAGRVIGVPPTTVVDCCVVSPHRRNNCLGRATVRSAVGRVLICPDMLGKHVGRMDRSERALDSGVLSCLVVPQRW